MSIQRAQEDPWTQEMAKWEARPVLVNGTFVQPIPIAAGGKENWPYQEYPKMLYRAEMADGGPRVCGQLIVHSAEQEAAEFSRGWSTSQGGAVDRVEAQQLEFAKLAANRAYNDRWMGGKALAESAAIDEATMEHLPSIPETPIRKKRPYVRKAKAE